MTQAALVSPHDAFGTNLFAHVLRGRLMRMVPRENEQINETWIADRDRFGFEGMYAADRVAEPLLRIDGELKSVDWEVALTAAAEGLQKTAGVSKAATGFLAAPMATLEEMFCWRRSRAAWAATISIIGCGSWIFAIRRMTRRFPILA